MDRRTSDLIFIKWFISVIFFLISLSILGYLGFINSLINNDASYITSLIFIIFTYFSIKVGSELYYLRARYMNINNLLSMIINKSRNDVNKLINTINLIEGELRDSKNIDTKYNKLYIKIHIINKIKDLI